MKEKVNQNQNNITIGHAIYENIPKEKIEEIYNAGFIGLSHKRTKNQNDTLIDRVSLLCESHTFDTSEWELSGMQYHEENTTACICGKTNLKKRYVMENLKNHSKISVGSSCLEKHFKLFLDKETLNAMEYVKGSGGKYSWLGAKYDAMIFSILGFKKCMLYFEDRRNKKTVDKEIDKLLKEALRISLADFKTTKWHERLERGRRLFQRFIENEMEAEKQYYIEEDRRQKLERKERRREVVRVKQNIEPYKEPLYKKTELQDLKLLDMLGIKNNNLSNDDTRTINTMKNYYKLHSKHREEELTEEYSVLHVGRNLFLISYKKELYALAFIDIVYYIYKVINEDELVYFGETSSERTVGNVIDKFYIEQENVF